MLVVDAGNEHVVERLLTVGAQVNHANAFGLNALCLAAKQGHENVVRCLLRSAKCDQDDQRAFANPLWLAASRDDLSMVQLLLRETKIGCHTTLSTCRLPLNTPLVAAMLRASSDVVHLLLSSPRIERNLTDRYGGTIMHQAWMVDTEHLDNTRIIISAKMFALNAKYQGGDTPLGLAVMNHSFDITKLLLQTGGVDANAANSHGQTPINVAIDNVDLKIVELLPDYGVNVKSCSDSEESAHRDCSERLP